MHRRRFLGFLGVAGILGAVPGFVLARPKLSLERGADVEKLTLDDAEWRERLSEERYRVLREADTEPAGSSPLDKETRAGEYRCAGCDLPLFSSRTKYDSGTGWPSFFDPYRRPPADRTGLRVADSTYRVPLRALWRASGPRLRGRSRADRPALVQQWPGAAVRARRDGIRKRHLRRAGGCDTLSPLL